MSDETKKEFHTPRREVYAKEGDDIKKREYSLSLHKNFFEPLAHSQILLAHC